MNKYPVNNYVPYNPDNVTKGGFGRSLGESLDQQKYEKIIKNPQEHFINSYVTNFDLINNECRGDKLENSRKYYETIFKEKIDKEINENQTKTYFISGAIRSERKDVFLKNDVLTEHFNRIKLEEKLEKQGIFLSAMKRNAFIKKKKKYTDDCNSVSF